MTNLKFHPLADLIPPMTDEEYATLVADIKANGLLHKIVLHEGMILDGRHRYRAAKEAGIDVHSNVRFFFRDFCPEVDGDPRAYVISANLHRRHLTAEKKRELITKLIKAQPEKPDLQIAKTVKVSPTTVGTVRAKMEAAGDVSKLETRTDTKGRKQPAKKQSKKERIQQRAERKRVRMEQDRARLAELRQKSEVRLKEDETRAKTAAAKLIVLIDRDLACEILHLQRTCAWLWTDALAGVLDDGAAADDPAVSAEAMKAKFAKLDDGQQP